MANFETTSAENSRLWRLTDKQVLDAMRGRGNELATAKSMAFLCQMFAKAAETNPAAAPGLLAAVGLTQLYGVGIAPGHEDHPFKNVDKNMTVASILNGTTPPKVERYTPPPVKHRTPRVQPAVASVRACAVPVLSFADVRLDQPCDHAGYVGHCPMCHTDLPNRMVTAVKSVQNIEKPKSKVKRVAEIVLAMFDEMGEGGMLTARAVHFRCASDIQYQDVQNGLTFLRSAEKIDKAAHGYVRHAA